MSEGSVHMGSQVSTMLASPNMEVKSQLFKPQETIKVWFRYIEI